MALLLFRNLHQYLYLHRQSQTVKTQTALHYNVLLFDWHIWIYIFDVFMLFLNVILIRVRLLYNTDDQMQEKNLSRSHQTLLTFGSTVNKSSTFTGGVTGVVNGVMTKSIYTTLSFKLFSTLGWFYFKRTLFNQGGSSYSLLTINSSVYTILQEHTVGEWQTNQIIQSWDTYFTCI